MGKTRTKKVLLAAISRQDAEAAIKSFTEAEARETAIISEMEAAVKALHDKHAAELARLGGIKEEAFEVLHAYGTSHRDEFGNKKSLFIGHGVIGFRTGTPKLKTLRGFTWPSVLNLVRELMPDYVRTTHEVAKDKLLNDRLVPEVNSMFTRIGVKVEQEETFYVEPKPQEATA